MERTFRPGDIQRSPEAGESRTSSGTGGRQEVTVEVRKEGDQPG